MSKTQIKTDALVDSIITSAKLASSSVAPGKADLTQIWDYSSGTLRVGAPAGGTDAANKTYVDSLLTGLQWNAPVSVSGYIGTRTVAQIDALSPASGDSVVAGDAGTPAAGSSDLLAAGDIAEFDGTQWKKIVANSGGFPPDGTRALVHTETVTLVAPLTDGVDEGKIAEWDGASLTPASLVSPTDGDALLVVGEASVKENLGYVYDGTVPTGDWIQFTGAGQIVAGAGLVKVSNTIDVGDINKGVQVNSDNLEIDASEIAASSGGLKQDPTNSWQLRIEPADFAGSGLVDDGADNLRVGDAGKGVQVNASDVQIDASEIAGNGLTQRAGGGNEHLLDVKADLVGGANLAKVIFAGTNGVAVKIDDVTIGESSNQLVIKTASITSGLLSAGVAGRLGGKWDGVSKFSGTGAATTFDLGHTDVDLTELGTLVTVDGIIQEFGAGNDFTFSDNTGAGGVDQIVFEYTPQSSAKIIVRYRRTTL